MQEIKNLQNTIGRGQQAHVDLVNDFASFRVKNRAEHAKFESNINLLVNENTKLKDHLRGVMLDRDAMALVVDEMDEKLNKVRPKESLFARFFKR